MEKWLFLLRAFFPSWKFFDQVGTTLDLQVRVGTSAESLSDWTECLPPISRSFKNLLLNPSGNFLHACRTHLTYLHSDILKSDEKKVEDLATRASFKVARNLAEFQILQLKLAEPPFLYQFRLTAGSLTDPTLESILVSPVHKKAR